MRADIADPLARTAAGAIAEEVLRACVHCGMCNATCPTYQLTGDELDGPRGRIWLMREALEGASIGRTTQRHLDRCLSCRACETTCPSGVEYHRLFDVGREAVEARVGRRVWERLARAAIRLIASDPAILGRLLAIGRAMRPLLPPALARKVPDRASPGRPALASHVRRMTLLAGCVQAAAAPHFNAATARVFDRLGVGLEAPPEVGCCGALDFHLGAVDPARRRIRRNIDAWTGQLDAGAEAVVVTASGCAAFIRDYTDVLADDPVYAERARRVAAAVRDPVEVLRDADLRPARPPSAPEIAVHDPCTLRNGVKLGGMVAELLARLGYQVQTTADPHQCCGSAGAYALLHPRLAGRLRENRLAALTAGAPGAIYTANIGCWLHLGETSPVPVRHWIEAVDAVI